MKKQTYWDQAARENHQAWRHYLDQLYDLAISMFKWEGLPDSVDDRYLEMSLFWNGVAIAFIDDVAGPMALQVLPGGQIDPYGNPTVRTAYGSNGFQVPGLTDSDSVLIWNNRIRRNTAPMIMRYAKRLWDLDRAVDINAAAQKTPVLIKGNENQRLTLKNIWMKYDGGEPMFLVDNALDVNQLGVINLEAPFVAPALHDLKCDIYNEVLTYLGISNVTQSKKERMLTDEVNRMMGGVLASRKSRLMMRERAAKQMNKLFGWNVSVEYDDGVEEMAKAMMDAEGGDEDEPLDD